MAAKDERAASEVLRALARHLNCLNEDSKTTRKRALEAIKRETIDKGLSSGVLQEIFTCLLKALLKCLSDPMERCRETAIHMLGDFIRCVPQPEDSLPYLMPALTQRLGGKEILEPAEELRLSMVEVLTLTVEVCGRHLAPYLDDMMKILQRTIVDPFPDVKRESCKCTVNFAKRVPEHFHMQAESLVKPLMQTISHQHSRVRVSTIEATGAVIQYGAGKNVDEVLSHLAQRLFDDSPQVRKAVTTVVGQWLLHLPDRYSYFHKLLPLLISSLSDDIPEISQVATDLWRQTGALWEQENEDDLKDKMDFLLTLPGLYPAGVERPGLGCRELVVRNLSKLLPALARDVADWVVGTRVKTAQLLYALLLHAEDHCTQHLQLLLSMLYRACADPERDVVANCLRSAKLLGTFVSPEVFLKLLLAHVDAPSSSSSPHTPVMVLGAVLSGCSRDLLRPHLQDIAGVLVQPDVCQEYQQTVYLEQLLSCVDVLLSLCEEDCGSISLQLLQVLITVHSLSTEPQLTDQVERSVQCLCRVQALPTVTDLYRQHMTQLLQWLSAFHQTWTSYSTQRLQLQVIVTQSGPVVGEFLPQLMPLLQKCLHPDRDPEMRLHVFTVLSRLLLDATHTLDSQGRFCEHLDVFLLDLLLPNLVWRAGRTAAAIRTSALSCLLALLQGGAITPGQLLGVEERLSPQVLSCLEEDSQLSRLLACQSLSTLLKLTGASLHADALNKLYPEVLKRLDDSSEEVRGVALSTLGQWLATLGKDYNTQLYSQHLEFLFQQLLLHLDDPDSRIQDTVLEVLKIGSAVHPVLLKQEVEAVRDKQRSPVYCDKLLQHIHSLPKDTA
ncbi:dynein assembly factor 5, axonemal [Esox lucius]|uniref:dynein assembly factor 5, axonemal n=1 Tax=Esox lucius TaxID=8010 RepID=UPI001476B10C|nr:dynein assembly factor 5, axonemal [Esox lucius]